MSQHEYFNHALALYLTGCSEDLFPYSEVDDKGKKCADENADEGVWSKLYTQVR